MRARKRFGQHFLEPAWVDKVIRAIDPQPHDIFIEIGPGRGAITRPLAARARAVLAYEIDRDLAAELRTTMPPNVTVIEGDFMTAPDDVRSTTSDQRPTSATSDPQPTATKDQRPAANDERLRVAGNLPYNVASPILFKLVDLCRAGAPIVDATVMLQREVADRLVAPPGSRDYGVLSILIGHRATATRLLTLPPGAFRPPPKVHSAVVRLQFHGPEPPVVDEQLFANLVRAVFTRRRKTLANALRAFRRVPPRPDRSPAQAGPASGSDQTSSGVRSDRGQTSAGLESDRTQTSIDPSRRPETLTIAEFAGLADSYAAQPR
jgi:16S rRNA (adenine1518-N6/adenine1519-N6)-dimethyltransferase